MKKLLLGLGTLLLFGQVKAQPWMKLDNNAPVKFRDILEQHYQNHTLDRYNEEDEDGDMPKGVMKEGVDYQFGRWAWYWEQHTDANGYIVSPMKTWEEWRSYQLKHKVQQRLARTTGASDMSAWTSQGPDTTTGGYGGLGRINVIAFHPTDTNTYWIGSPGGGAWKTTDDGNNWTCMTDGLPLLSVSDIDFNPLNPKTVYLCTGDRDGGDNYSIGVLKSMDGGATWDTTGLHWNTYDYRLTNAMVINKLDSNCLVVATSAGIYKSTNGGATFSRKQTGDFKDIVYNPTDTNVIYAARNNQIFRSGDDGDTWTQVTSFTGVNHVAIAVTADNPSIVKAVTSSSVSGMENGLDGIYSSSDTGMSFTEIYKGSCDSNLLGYAYDGKSCGGQGWYDLCIAISPTDSDRVYVGGVNSWYSEDGGKSWQLMTFWYEGSPFSGEVAHADKHYMAFSPLKTNRLFQCNDGGVYMSDNPKSIAWANKLSNGLRITEFYRNSVVDDTTYVLGGAQDNGTKMITDSAVSYDVGGGDGMECQIDFSNPSVYYLSYPGGSISIKDHGAETNISNNITGNPQGTWVTPFALSPTNSNYIVAGYKVVYESGNRGAASTWSAISDTLAVGTYDYINRIGLTGADVATVYATINNKDSIYYTHGSMTWSRIYVPFGHNVSISDIKVDPTNSNHFWITFSGYDTAKVAEYDDSTGWSTLNTNLPNVPVNCIELDTSNATLYIGTDVGVFYRNDTMTMWQPYNNGLPSVRVNDLGISYSRDELWAATYGRGMWKTPLQVFDTTTHIDHSGISIVPFKLNSLKIAPNPNHGDFTIMADGIKNEEVNILMVDYAGRVVLRSNGTFDGSGKLEIKTQGLAHGTYIVELAAKNSIIGRNKVVIY